MMKKIPLQKEHDSARGLRKLLKTRLCVECSGCDVMMYIRPILAFSYSLSLINITRQYGTIDIFNLLL